MALVSNIDSVPEESSSVRSISVNLSHSIITPMTHRRAAAHPAGMPSLVTEYFPDPLAIDKSLPKLWPIQSAATAGPLSHVALMPPSFELTLAALTCEAQATFARCNPLGRGSTGRLLDDLRPMEQQVLWLRH